MTIKDVKEKIESATVVTIGDNIKFLKAKPIEEALAMLDEMEKEYKRDKVLFASLLLHKLEPMASHHVQAVRERLNYPTDDDILRIIHMG